MRGWWRDQSLAHSQPGYLRPFWLGYKFNSLTSATGGSGQVDILSPLLVGFNMDETKNKLEETNEPAKGEGNKDEMASESAASTSAGDCPPSRRGRHRKRRGRQQMTRPPEEAERCGNTSQASPEKSHGDGEGSDLASGSSRASTAAKRSRGRSTANQRPGFRQSREQRTAALRAKLKRRAENGAAELGSTDPVTPPTASGNERTLESALKETMDSIAVIRRVAASEELEDEFARALNVSATVLEEAAVILHLRAESNIQRELAAEIQATLDGMAQSERDRPDMDDRGPSGDESVNV